MLEPINSRLRPASAVSGRGALGLPSFSQAPVPNLLSGRALAGHLGVKRQRPSFGLLEPMQLTLPTPLPDFYQVKAEVERRQLAALRTITPKEAGYPIPFLSPAEQARRAREHQRTQTRAQHTYQQLVAPLYFASQAQALPSAKPKLKAGGSSGTLPAGISDCFMPVTFWKSQNPKNIKGNWSQCCATCKVMIERAEGYVPQTRVQLLAESSGHLVAQKNWQSGLAKLDNYLAKSIPVMIGVHYKFGTTYNADHTTEHFIVLVGAGIEHNQRYYRFFDVGTIYKKKGTDPRNKLYYDAATNSYSGKSYATNHTYTLVQLRFK